MQEALQIDPETMAAANFMKINDYADAWICRDFEHVPMPGNNTFDPNTYEEMRSIQKIKLDTMFTVDSRRLYLSRLFRKPLKAIQDKVACLTTGCPENYDKTLKYMIYSAHDD